MRDEKIVVYCFIRHGGAEGSLFGAIVSKICRQDDPSEIVCVLSV